MKKRGFNLIVVAENFKNKASPYTLNLLKNKEFFDKIFECDNIEIYKIK
ncbi:MAG: hypothetical protein ABIN20_02260 [candidate division WOR-3 bacterium]